MTALATYSPAVGARIITAAARFVGLTEVRSNAKWDNLSLDGNEAIADELVAELLRVGWQSGWPYCAAFCEVAWKIGYQGRPELGDVRAMLNPSCLASFRNAAERNWTSLTPSIGSIGIMQKGSSGNGHAFLVRGVAKDNKTLCTIEANTSPEPGSAEADREGDGIYCKTRPYSLKPTTGLHLIGFITPNIDT